MIHFDNSAIHLAENLSLPQGGHRGPLKGDPLASSKDLSIGNAAGFKSPREASGTT